MSDYFKGVTFPWQGVTPSDDAIVRRAILPDRCLSGCELTYSGYTLTMAAGSMIVCGRQLKHTAAQNWAITGATSGYARLLLTIDVTKASTEDAFEQIATSIEYASASDGFSALRQDDINSAGTIYQVDICVVALGAGGITRIVSSLTKGNLDSDDVGARPSTWMPTAADVGAAPSGLVLQSFTANSNSEITEALTTVFNSMGNDTVGYCHIHVSTSGLDLYDTSWYIEIRRRNATYATVTAKSILNNYTMQRAFGGGNWQDWEWFNPPMVAGKEYRTAERYRTKVVYVQLVNLGSMPNKTVKNITFKPANIADRISCELMMQLASSNHTETCPAVGTSISDIETMATWLGNNTDSVIRVATKYDRSSYTGFALCKYTKG